MKKTLSFCVGVMLLMPVSTLAENNSSGPFVECLLPSGNIEFIPAMFCEIKRGKYHY